MKKRIQILLSLLIIGVVTCTTIHGAKEQSFTADELVPKGAGRFSLPATKTEEVFALLLVLLADLALRLRGIDLSKVLYSGCAVIRREIVCSLIYAGTWHVTAAGISL